MLADFQPKPRALWIAAFTFAALVIADSWFRWWSFQYTTLDLAFYQQSFWLLLRGLGNVSLLDVPLMGHHAEPICFLLLPFFWFWQHPMFFVVVQTLLVTTMIFTGYRIARRLDFEPRSAMWMALSTLLAPASGFMALHEFHPETLAAPLILLMLEARLAQRPGSYWVCFILAAMCRENVALMLAWMCAINWFVDRPMGRSWQVTFNIVPGVVALVWVGIYATWLMPLWSGGRMAHWEMYAHLGGSGREVMGKIFTDPLALVRAFWEGVTGGNLIWGLLLPMLLLPLLRPRYFFIAAPILAQHLLSSRAAEWTINFHYAAPLVPLIWMASAEAAANMFWRENVARWIAAACALAQVTMGPAKAIFLTAMRADAPMASRDLKAKMLAKIPPNAAVMVGLPMLSHLGKRAQLHSVHFTLEGMKALRRETYVPPAVDVIALDYRDSATFDRLSGYYHPTMQTSDARMVPDSNVALHRSMLGKTWQVEAVNSLALYTKVAEVTPQPLTREGKVLDATHRLVSLESLPGSAPGTLKLRITWELEGNRTMIPWEELLLEDAAGKSWRVLKGALAPGCEGGRFQEEWVVSPKLPAGTYRAQLLIYDNLSDLRISDTKMEARLFEIGKVSL